MLSNAQNKYIRSLTQQKFRNEYKVFIAEGDKIAREWLLATHPISMILATAAWADENARLMAKHPEAEQHIVKEHELKALSSLSTPNQVLLVIPKPPPTNIPTATGWGLALSDIQDPGNMGTIIRIADWFGAGSIVCSPGCVDVYNPKVVQSAMGGHLRVKLFEADLVQYLSAQQLPILAATLHGNNIYQLPKPPAGILVIGNESKGVSPAVLATVTQQVTIPRIGGAESLNAGVSAGILCALLMGR